MNIEILPIVCTYRLHLLTDNRLTVLRDVFVYTPEVSDVYDQAFLPNIFGRSSIIDVWKGQLLELLAHNCSQFP